MRSFHVHDGFYLRLNAGIGFVGADFSNGGTENDDLSADGSDLALDVLVGGSPSRGVAVGGALLSNTLLAADLEQSGDTVTDRDISIVLLGPFIDGFPNAKRGWHLGGTIGLSAVKQKDLGEFGQTDRTTFREILWRFFYAKSKRMIDQQPGIDRLWISFRCTPVKRG